MAGAAILQAREAGGGDLRDFSGKPIIMGKCIYKSVRLTLGPHLASAAPYQRRGDLCRPNPTRWPGAFRPIQAAVM